MNFRPTEFNVNEENVDQTRAPILYLHIKFFDIFEFFHSRFLRSKYFIQIFLLATLDSFKALSCYGLTFIRFDYCSEFCN